MSPSSAHYCIMRSRPQKPGRQYFKGLSRIRSHRPGVVLLFDLMSNRVYKYRGPRRCGVMRFKRFVWRNRAIKRVVTVRRRRSPSFGEIFDPGRRGRAQAKRTRNRENCKGRRILMGHSSAGDRVTGAFDQTGVGKTIDKSDLKTRTVVTTVAPQRARHS